jgi:hypothetical protein
MGLSSAQWQKSIQKNDKITTLTEDPDSIIVVTDNRNRVRFIHSCKKFGGPCTKSATLIGGLIGKGAWAFPIIIDKDDATSSMSVKIPTTSKIWACKDTEQLKNLLSNTARVLPPSPKEQGQDQDRQLW